MLEIYVRGHEQPLICRERLEALLHDVRVIQGIPFLALEDDGDLLNLNEVWRIVEVSADEPNGTGHPEPMLGREDPPVRTIEDYQVLAERGVPLVDTCPHGYVAGTCSECRALADEAERNQPQW